MSSFHAAWSFGGLAGAALGGLLASLGVGPLPHFCVVAILSLIAFVGAYGALLPSHADASEEGAPAFARPTRDRKSTRLNSSHANISYAVFCLKKKIQRSSSPPISID